MLQNQILEEAHLLILICHAKKNLYTHFHALITICSVWLILAPTILYYMAGDLEVLATPPFLRWVGEGVDQVFC